MKVAYLLYPGFTALDVVGTFQVLAAAPAMRSVFVAAEAGAVVDDTGSCPLLATARLADVVSADMVVVPGGEGSCEPDLALVRWVRAMHRTTTWTLSVGTGSSYLAAAGVLDGAAAATHWAATWRLTDAGVAYSDRAGRAGGKVLTCAGSSAGLDLALTCWASPTVRPSRRPCSSPCSTTPNPPTTPARRRRRPPTSASS